MKMLIGAFATCAWLVAVAPHAQEVTKDSTAKDAAKREPMEKDIAHNDFKKASATKFSAVKDSTAKDAAKRDPVEKDATHNGMKKDVWAKDAVTKDAMKKDEAKK